MACNRRTTKTPVVPARGHAILTPDGFQSVDLTQGRVGMMPPDRPHAALEAAYHVTINVDTVIFDDGLVLGPDKTGLVDSINARAIAIGRVLETVRRATAEGQDITAALRGLMPPPGTNFAVMPPDPITNWIIVYTGELVRFPERRDRRVQELRQLPTPPTFFHK